MLSLSAEHFRLLLCQLSQIPLLPLSWVQHPPTHSLVDFHHPQRYFSKSDQDQGLLFLLEPSLVVVDNRWQSTRGRFVRIKKRQQTKWNLLTRSMLQYILQSCGIIQQPDTWGRKRKWGNTEMTPPPYRSMWVFHLSLPFFCNYWQGPIKYLSQVGDIQNLDQSSFYITGGVWRQPHHIYRSPAYSSKYGTKLSWRRFKSVVFQLFCVL